MVLTLMEIKVRLILDSEKRDPGEGGPPPGWSLREAPQGTAHLHRQSRRFWRKNISVLRNAATFLIYSQDVSVNLKLQGYSLPFCKGVVVTDWPSRVGDQDMGARGETEARWLCRIQL